MVSYIRSRKVIRKSRRGQRLAEKLSRVANRDMAK